MQRLDFIRACHAGTDSFSALCRLFGISRKTGYKWLQRFDPSDLSSLSDRSRAPHSHSRTVPDDIAGQLTALRQKHPDWGPNVAAQSSRRFYRPCCQHYRRYPQA
nr:helix-turn-helix domain-containing protein [Enterobacter asburiae]